MYPDKLPQYILDDPQLSGERKVYDALARHLPDEYTVLYRAHFCLRRGGGGFREKEIDFLVIHR
ncbi:MAG: NERD domain-containing protein, partial [Candidatus Sumerlaeia bacterium]|nr:NERD domain-containing protein [Candidatus Sumerlaeia bacterium]